jgi:hypothetical protein
MMTTALLMKIIAFKSLKVIAPGDRLFCLPKTKASIFNPFQVPRREIVVKQLPENQLLLFQHFIPISVVNN